MALITDPDLLNDGAADNGTTEVYLNTATKTIKLNTTGNLSTDGVTLKALYSFLKEEWRNDPQTKNLAAFPFPMVPITDESYEFVDGWDFVADASRYLIRTGGWTVRNTSGAVTQKWAGIIGLGTIEANDQLYFYQGAGSAITNVQLTGQVNQAVKVLDDPNGDGNYADGFDRRGSFTLYVREQGQLMGKAALTDIGVTQMDSIAYRFPISTAADLKVTHTDVQIDANTDGVPDVAPYTGMSITYYATPQARNVGASSYNFGVIIDGNGGTAEQIYEFVQFQLRRNADIDAGAGSVIGKTADELLQFVGDTLKTRAATNPAGGGTGVFIDNYQAGDINRLVMKDNLGTERTFPFTATLTLEFNANLVNDASAKYWVFFSDLPGAADYGSAGAVLVDDGAGADITGNVSGSASIQKTFAYDTNVQGGRTAGTDAAITVIAQGLQTGQYVRATGTIARSTANKVALVAPLERNYANA